MNSKTPAHSTFNFPVSTARAFKCLSNDQKIQLTIDLARQAEADNVEIKKLISELTENQKAALMVRLKRLLVISAEKGCAA